VNKAASYTLRASYDTNGIFAAANFVNVAGILGTATPGSAKDGKITIVSLAGGYDFGVAKVRAQIVSSKANAAAATVEAKQNVATVGGQFKLSDDDTISAQYVKAQELKLAGTAAAGSGASGFALSFDHAMSKNTTVYAAYAKVSNGAHAIFSATGYAHGGVGLAGSGSALTTVAGNNSPSAFSVGMIRNF
jgi:predicted porin